MDVSAITALTWRYKRRLYKRALDLMESDDTCKLYQVDILPAVEWMSDIWDKVDSITTNNCW